MLEKLRAYLRLERRSSRWRSERPALYATFIKEASIDSIRWRPVTILLVADTRPGFVASLTPLYWVYVNGVFCSSVGSPLLYILASV